MKVELEFFPASEPPDADTTVICCDGEDVFTGWYEGKDEDTPLWFDSTGRPCDVKSWAHVPDALECLIPSKTCTCISFHERTGEHVEGCSLHE